MIAYLVRCHVKPGCEAAFVAACEANARESRKEAGILRFDLLGEEDPSRFVLYEVYRDAEAPKLHKDSPHYAAWRDAIEPILAEARTKEVLAGLSVPALRG